METPVSIKLKALAWEMENRDKYTDTVSFAIASYLEGYKDCLKQSNNDLKIINNNNS